MTMMKPARTIRCCSFLILALLASCKPASHATVSSRSQQLASESATAFDAKDYGKAQALAAEATRIDPQFAEAWVAFGMASVRLGQTEVARQTYERALSLHQARRRQDPSDANQVIQEIFVLEMLGRATEAEALLKQSRLDYPNDKTLTKLAENPETIKNGVENSGVIAR